MRCEKRWSGGARSGADVRATGGCFIGYGGRSMFWMEAEEDAACRHTGMQRQRDGGGGRQRWEEGGGWVGRGRRLPLYAT